MTTVLRISLLSALLGLVTGCAARYPSKVNFNPLEPLRVAVLPFRQVNTEGKDVAPDDGLLLDEVGFALSKVKQPPSRFVQNLVLHELSKTSLDVVAPALVEGQLSHHGLYRPDGQPDGEKIFGAKREELCEKLLQCDALLYGTVRNWERSYYGVESRSSITFDLTLVSAKTGATLYSVSAADSDSRGITKGPTGFTDLVIEPIRGLSSDVITTLARSMVQQAVSPLVVSSRPEFLATPPPAIFGSAHDALDGTVSRTHPMVVLVLGTPHANATFSLGRSITNIPMTERDEGHYFGEFHPNPQDSFDNQPVLVTLTDRFGRTATQTVGRTVVSLQQ